MDFGSKGSMATIGAAGGVVGFVADRNIKLPSITGNPLADRAIDVGIGAVIAAAGYKVGHDGIGAGIFGAGVGWAFSALLGFAGI
jgi:hypothetical protein